MNGLVEVRLPAGAVVQLTVDQLRELEGATRPAVKGAPVEVDKLPVSDKPVEVTVEVTPEVPGKGYPKPADLTDEEKQAIREWFTARGDGTPKYITKKLIRQYVDTTGDKALDHLFDKPAEPVDEPAEPVDDGLVVAERTEDEVKKLAVEALSNGLVGPEVMASLVARYAPAGEGVASVPVDKLGNLYVDIQRAVGGAL